MTNIDDTVSKFNMLDVGDTVLAAVSGGADSMLMLHYLLSVKDKFNLSIIVANVEHGIRGKESLRDTNFVKKICDKHNLTFKGISIDAPNEAKQRGISVEAYSRMKRYEFFESIDCDKIATAHNLSDNVETVLFRLARGTSIKGCCGIPPVRGKIIRPLIECSSKDIRDYCDNNNIEYVVDSTNSDNNYSRNLIRNDIINKLLRINSNFEDNINRFITSVNEDYNFIQKCSEKAYNVIVNDNSIDVNLLKNYDISIIKRVIIKYLFTNNITVDELHLNGILELINKNGRYQIKGNDFVVCNSNVLRIENVTEKIDFSKATVVKKVLTIDEYLTNSELLLNQFDFYCDCDKICSNVTVRERLAGDCLRPANRNCTKTLKKLFNEYKVSSANRKNIPILCDCKGIIGVVGFCCDERVKVDKSTKNVLLINIRMEDSV